MSEQKDVAARRKIVPKKALLLAGLLIVVVLGVWFAQTPAFRLATTHQPERFTELYFAQPTSLPKKIEADKTYRQMFVIVNHEATPQTYTYQVTLADKNGTRPQKPVTVKIADGQRATPHFTYETAAADDSLQVTVTLLTQKQSIHFRAES